MPTIGGTNQCLLYDNSGVIAETHDAGGQQAIWDNANHWLAISAGGRFVMNGVDLSALSNFFGNTAHQASSAFQANGMGNGDAVLTTNSNAITGTGYGMNATVNATGEALFTSFNIQPNGAAIFQTLVSGTSTSGYSGMRFDQNGAITWYFILRVSDQAMYLNQTGGVFSSWTFKCPKAGGVIIGAAALAANATDGFLYIPTYAAVGAPTGVPTTQTGTVAMVYNTTDHKLYIYDSGWKGGTVPGVWS
jgi:hypothetical protein